MATWLPSLGSFLWEAPILEIDVEMAHGETNNWRAGRLAQEMHEDNKAYAKRFFEEHYKQAERNKMETLHLACEHHKQSMAQAQRLYEKQRDYEERLAAREARRDMWDQKTEQTSTLLVLNTVMFTCLFSTLTQGMPPDSTSEPWLMAFSVTLALSFAALFLSIVYALSLQFSMTQYRIDNPSKLYSCGHRHMVFYSFWRCHCAPFSKAAYMAFFVGTCCLAANACILVHERFLFEYDSIISSILFQSVTLSIIPLLILWHYKPFLNLVREGLTQYREMKRYTALVESTCAFSSEDVFPSTPPPAVIVTQPDSPMLVEDPEQPMGPTNPLTDQIPPTRCSSWLEPTPKHLSEPCSEYGKVPEVRQHTPSTAHSSMTASPTNRGRKKQDPSRPTTPRSVSGRRRTSPPLTPVYRLSRQNSGVREGQVVGNGSFLEMSDTALEFATLAEPPEPHDKFSSNIPPPPWPTRRTSMVDPMQSSHKDTRQRSYVMSPRPRPLMALPLVSPDLLPKPKDPTPPDHTKPSGSPASRTHSSDMMPATHTVSPVNQTTPPLHPTPLIP